MESKEEQNTAPANSEALIQALGSLGFRRVCFIRHANSKPGAGLTRKDQPHDWKIDDQMRMLTPKGWEQCKSASTWFATLDCKAILSSPARRAAETAMAMQNQVETEEKGAATLHVGMVDAIHPAGTSEVCEDLFETRGYGPLRGFFEVGDAGQGAAAFTAYAELACGRLLSHIQGPLMGEALARQDGDGIEGTFAGTGGCPTLAVFGHAVFLNAIAYVISAAAGGKSLDFVLDMDLGETEGALISLSDGNCVHMKQSPE